VGMSFAAVPLYDWFCRVTGFGGTPQIGLASETVLDREITVRFDASTNPALDWRFSPAQREVVLRVGETGLGFYRAQSEAGVATKGTSTFNVTPLKAGQYFVKIECFCFTEQLLQPGEAIDMPVTFFVDPAIAEDEHMDDVKTITLSYTFFPLEDDDDGEARTASLDGSVTE
jgi:cytochrome c oxidase assembly protein subunit 11